MRQFQLKNFSVTVHSDAQLGHNLVLASLTAVDMAYISASAELSDVLGCLFDLQWIGIPLSIIMTPVCDLLVPAAVSPA